MNKQRVTILLIVFTVGLLIASYGFAAPGFFDFSIPKDQKEIELKQEADMKVKNFKEKVDLDIANAFAISIEGFESIDIDNLLTSDIERDISLSSVYWETISDGKPGDIMPSIYLKGDFGYILIKKFDGSNHLYTIRYQDDKWEISDYEKKPGKYIEMD